MPEPSNQSDLKEADRMLEQLQFKIADAKATAKPEQMETFDDIELALGWTARKLAKLRQGG